MTEREKLVKLLKRTEYQFTVAHSLTVENVADDLIQNGVTVQGWIPVTERLPEEDGYYLVCSERGAVYANRFYAKKLFTNGYMGGYVREAHWSQRGKVKITHWMPLPEPPKGG